MILKINNKIITILDYKSFIKKLFGLMFKKNKINYGIRLNNCNSIHTFFMMQDIDICITDKNNKILFLKANLTRNKIITIKHGYYTYELPLDTVKYLKVNDILNIEKEL